MRHVSKNVGFVRGGFDHFSLPKRWGWQLFHFSDHHNFHIHDPNWAEKVDLDSTHQELSIDMLHDTLFPYRFQISFSFEFWIQKYSRWVIYRLSFKLILLTAKIKGPSKAHPSPNESVKYFGVYKASGHAFHPLCRVTHHFVFLVRPLRLFIFLLFWRRTCSQRSRNQM